jgi:hypothetical protein
MSFADRIGEFLAYVFQPVSPLLSLAFAAALFWRGLRAYWVVAVYFLAASIHGALSYLYKIDQNPPVYIAFTGVELVLLGAIAWELGRRSFVSYPSLAAFVTRTLWILLPICVMLALVTYLTDPPAGPDRHPKLQLTFAVERSVHTAILVFLLAIAGFAGWFPVRMKQNSARLLIGFLVLHTYQWIALLAANMHWQWTYWASFWHIFVLAEILIYWLIALKPAGEVAIASTVPNWNPVRMQELTGQLEEIHSQLARRGF